MLAASLVTAATMVGTAPPLNATTAATRTETWSAVYDGALKDYDIPWAIAQSPDGTRVYVTGETTGQFQEDYGTVAYDARTGAQLWASTYDGPGHQFDIARALAVSPDGTTVYVTGESVGSNPDYATVAYDAQTGLERWVVRFNGLANGEDAAAAVAVSADGSYVYVTGTSFSGIGGTFDRDFVTIAYSPTGKELWRATFDGLGRGYDQAMSMAVTADGTSVLVAGQTDSGASNYDYGTVSYDAKSGAEIWVARYDGLGHDYDVPARLALDDRSGLAYVTGMSRGLNTGLDAATVAYSVATGIPTWVARSTVDGDDRGVDLAVAPDGSGVFVANAAGNNFVTTALASSNGSQRWSAVYDGGSAEWPNAIAASPDGSRVYITGRSDRVSTSFDLTTVAYATGDGATDWTATKDLTGGEDTGQGLIVSPDSSRVYVTGYAYKGARFFDFDYLTLAYPALTVGVPSAPALSVGDVSVHEGNAGTRAAVFTLSLSKPTTTTVGVSYATANGTATAPSDYVARSGTLSFAPGVTSQVIKVPVNGDSAAEGDESISLVLSSPTNGARIGDGTGVGTIVDDDPSSGKNLAIGDVSVHEGDGGDRVAVFNVSLSKPVSGTVTVSYATANASATKGSDYIARTGTLSFASGVTSASIKITIKADTIAEGNEAFSVKLSGASGATITDGVGVGTIIDND